MQAEATIDFSTFDKAKGSDLSLSCLHVQCNLIDNELPCSANDAGLKLLARRSRPELGLAYLGTALATSPSSTDMATPSLDPTDPQAPSTGDLTPSLYRSHRFEEAILPALAETRKRPSFSRAHSAFEATPLREDARPVFDPHYALMQMSLPRRSSDGNPRFYPESYNGHSRHHTASSLASTFGSTSGPYTPDEETNRYSWTTASSRSNDMEASMQQLGHGSKKTESRSQLADLASSNAGLMGDAHFGPAVREKVAEAVAGLMQGVSMSGEEDEVLTLCEYGALNSRWVRPCSPSTLFDEAQVCLAHA